eukprot:c1806_g2_i1.p1 GENE.c1806_g2_i1~~c1806_g2_i1.p1  ORF type:complete len:393 (-),score=150.41 c1806_g2_i1:15-1133(-)
MEDTQQEQLNNELTLNYEPKMCFSTKEDEETFSKKYELTKMLGSGAYAEVWEAKNIKTEEIVAVKILQGENTKDVEEILKQNENEIACLKSLNHPNIVSLYDVVVAEDRVLLVQELAQKGDLFDFMFSDENTCNDTGRGLCEADAQFYFSQLIYAIDHMHKSGYAHRDIKIENCLITKTGKLLLCDFGMATTKLKCDNRCGTLDYIAPEVIVAETVNKAAQSQSLSQKKRRKNKGNKNNNNNGNTYIEEGWFSPFVADVWSCGVFLYYILTSDLPFEDESREVTKANILSGEISIPDYISESAKDLISKMLNVNPSKRCSIDDVLSHPFLKTSLVDDFKSNRPASIAADDLAGELSELTISKSSSSIGSQNA